MQAGNLGCLALWGAGELGRLCQASGDEGELGGFGIGHAAAASFSVCCFSSSQTKAAVSSMERGSLVVSSTKMLTSFGIALPISVARMVVAAAQTLLSNFGTFSTGLVAPVSGGELGARMGWV